ncbi:hypothetical protein SS50377_27973 [Spironucleus salmonicida]|uniref:Secreted protein n=1 Tax=Spironucleus salmonicida TaxID=348837 RepID=V6LFP9_9EUKA|nr:hypothetical protein SS50377_27973 [Spironucleus salmonicida]|eukprot:EST42531.1 Hypothetical protein SS50377_17844 [Spironucleus salmonicida]
MQCTLLLLLLELSHLGLKCAGGDVDADVAGGLEDGLAEQVLLHREAGGGAHADVGPEAGEVGDDEAHEEGAVEGEELARHVPKGAQVLDALQLALGLGEEVALREEVQVEGVFRLPSRGAHLLLGRVGERSPGLQRGQRLEREGLRGLEHALLLHHAVGRAEALRAQGWQRGGLQLDGAREGRGLHSALRDLSRFGYWGSPEYLTVDVASIAPIARAAPE